MHIAKKIPLNDKNWFKTGGSAAFFTEPETADEFQQVLDFAKTGSLPIFVMGHGANVLFSDEGFKGLVIRPALLGIAHHTQNYETAAVTAGAGVSIDTLIEYCLSNNLLGLEEFSGIPGTVGGAVYINLHYFEFLISHFLISGTIIHKETGVITTVFNDWFKFGYNSSELEHEQYYLIDATFRVKKAKNSGDIFHARGRKLEIIRHRQRRYPQGGTCGSFFRNFHDEELFAKSGITPVPFVAYYLDKAGVRGSLRYNSAMVSHQHANMLVSDPTGGQSADIILVAREMQRRVYNTFGLLPQPECRLVGFSEYPLYTLATLTQN